MGISTMSGSELIISDKGDLYHINFGRKQKVPTNMLLVGEPDRVNLVTEFFDRGIEGEARHREFVTLWGHYRGVPVAAMGTGIGTDNTEIAVVERHAADEYNPETDAWEDPVKGVKIRVGTSASPQEDVPLGSLAITEHAIGLDNTGLYYLHHPRVTDYADPEFGPFYTPGNENARRVFEAVRAQLWHQGVVRPYVSTMTPRVVAALQENARLAGIPMEEGIGAYTGITSSASGFYGAQGRRIGRLSNILIPDLQDRLQALRAERTDGTVLRVNNNEMEASVLGRLNAEILGDDAGAVCLVIANRQKGQFITPEDFDRGIRKAIKVALEAVCILS